MLTKFEGILEMMEPERALNTQGQATAAALLK